MENNKAIAGLLRQIAALLQEQEVAFKPAAYRRAAQVIEELPKDVSAYGGVKELKKLTAIGDAIAKKIIEYLETGKITTLEKLRIVQGGISADLMDIEGLGPKRVRQIQMAFGVKTVADLIKVAQEGKLRTLPRFSELMEKKILENAKRVKERTKRFDRDEVKSDVDKLMEKIKSIPGIDRCQVAGSYRREKETVGDIDILVVTNSPGKVSDAIAKLPLVRDVVAHGEKKLSFDLKSSLRASRYGRQAGLRVDIRFVKKSQWGAALLYFTGSKEHNIAMRQVAMKKGWKLNEYGLFEGDKVITSKTEEEIYKALELKYYEPRERAGRL